jgi:ABC-type nitrate/sulfonate/bicarbonate transport system permease component
MLPSFSNTDAHGRPFLEQAWRGRSRVRVFVSLVLLGVAGTILFFAVDYAERLCPPWHVSQRSRQVGPAK